MKIQIRQVLVDAPDDFPDGTDAAGIVERDGVITIGITPRAFDDRREACRLLSRILTDLVAGTILITDTVMTGTEGIINGLG